MIEKIITSSRTTDIHGTTRLLFNAYQQSGFTEDRTLNTLFTAINDRNTTLGNVIDQSKAQSILAGKDDNRDDDARAVGYLVKGYTYHPDETTRNAALKVDRVFNKYGLSITEESYVTESSHIVSMLGDFAAPDLVAAIALLPGVAENIASLQAAQDDFENTQTGYAKELAAEDNLPTATELKKEVVALINDDLVVFLRAAERFQAETYGAFAATVAKIIADNNETVRKRWNKDDAEE
ncbi:DUF6261 family protein [Draconibacterium halophilum]|uniref:Uncharacterized protein n=1 Tax=Draconibacterium halophilum TaxID=2706887 RepID=A0A6C0RDS4_9BACT|nr:DUF6261 family protein [Draconibacterium halophilum]QIA07301.1 hypothetical protein G0Q07_05985 [Draconibacterium halophilum]